MSGSARTKHTLTLDQSGSIVQDVPLRTLLAQSGLKLVVVWADRNNYRVFLPEAEADEST
jgi:hypothetical protein